MQILWGVGGVLVLLAIAFSLSTNRRAINPRTVIVALLIQIAFAFAVLYWDFGRRVLRLLTDGVQAVIDSSNAGIEFLFGPVLPGGDSGPVFAFQVLPIIIFFASLTSVLYHLKVLQWVVTILGGALQKALGKQARVALGDGRHLSQADGGAAGREALRGEDDRLRALHRHGGRAGERRRLHPRWVLAPWGAAGIPARRRLHVRPGGAPDGEDHNARDEGAGVANPGCGGRVGPAGEGFAALQERHRRGGERRGRRPQARPECWGDADRLRLADRAREPLLLGALSGLFGFDELSLQLVLGYVFAPVAFVIGVPWSEVLDAGNFIGQKIILNEFVAYSNFGPRVDEFSEKTIAIVSFALAGFANFGTLAILIGGVGGLAPSRRSQIAQFGIRALIAGTLANLLNAAIAGMLVG